MDFSFFFNSALFGVGLAMDAFSVSLANGLNDPNMKKHRTILISSVFTFFQIIMPLIGWVCVSTMANRFKVFEKYIPYIALVLLVFIGGKMLYEGICGGDEDECGSVCLTALLVQGVATSIDALSVGFTISDYSFIKALISCLIIGAVTFVICFAGVEIGKKAGTKLAGKASIFGGVILIFIGLEIFISSFF